jgi:hypothetical protein
MPALLLLLLLLPDAKPLPLLAAPWPESKAEAEENVP